nr:UDP-glucuronosyltransferase [Nilaparvata lugens]
MGFKNKFITILLSMLMVTSSNAGNILSIIVFPSYSHQQPLLALSEKLARRGHNLTVLTTNPPKKPIPNYTYIDMSSAYKNLKEMDEKFGFNLQREMSAVEIFKKLPQVYSELCDYELGLPQVQAFISKAASMKFDAVLIENLYYSSFHGLTHKLGSPPVIGVHTFVPWSALDEFMGVKVNPSYMPHVFSHHSDSMNFFERCFNTFLYWYNWYLVEYELFPYQEAILKKYFGTNTPSAREMEFNKSLLLVPADLSVAYPMSIPPNYVRTGTFHIQPSPEPLPKDLKQWIDEAEQGIVYFSLGSNMQGTSVPQEKREIFFKTIRRFPKIRFFWKYEAESPLSNVPSNLLIRKWFPQQSILVHPKCRMFISQGGLQSTEEAIYYAVPLLVIPLFADQPHQAAKIEKEGAGLSLLLSRLTEDNFYDAINSMLTEPKFKSNMNRLSSLSKDQMVPALDEAAWWVEYVIRHKGARHLRPQNLNMNWIQVQLVDVYGAFVAAVLFVLYIIYKLIKSIVSLIPLGKSKKGKKAKSKRS